MDIHIYEIHECANDRHNPPVLAVAKSDFDRVTAERDALQLRLNAVEEENDRLRALLSRSIPYLSNTPDIVQIGAEELASEIRSGLDGRPCYGPNEWGTECQKCQKCDKYALEKLP